MTELTSVARSILNNDITVFANALQHFSNRQASPPTAKSDSAETIAEFTAFARSEDVEPKIKYQF